MAETYTKFDMADLLRDDEDVALYLDEVASENDPEALAAALGTVARARDMGQLALEAGLTTARPALASGAGGNTSLATVMKVASALGYQVSFKSKAA